jgi:hypothetical protein
MKTCGGENVLTHVFLTLALVRDEWSASRPCLFSPGENVFGTNLIGGWMCLRAGLDDMEKWKFLTLPRIELWPVDRPAHSQSLHRLQYLGSNLQLQKCKFLNENMTWKANIIICIWSVHCLWGKWSSAIEKLLATETRKKEVCGIDCAVSLSKNGERTYAEQNQYVNSVQITVVCRCGERKALWLI